MAININQPETSVNTRAYAASFFPNGEVAKWEVRDIYSGQISNRAGPAIVDQDGVSYYINGVFLNEDLWHAVVAQGIEPVRRGDGIFLYKIGTQLLHAEAGVPAVSYLNGIEEYYNNGLRHRIDGPALTSNNQYFLDGIQLSKEEFEVWRLLGDSVLFAGIQSNALFTFDSFGLLKFVSGSDAESKISIKVLLEIKEKYPQTFWKLKELMSDAGHDLTNALAIVCVKNNAAIDSYLASVRYNKFLSDKPLTAAIEFWEKSALDEWVECDASGAVVKLPDSFRTRLRSRTPPPPTQEMDPPPEQLEMGLAEPPSYDEVVSEETPAEEHQEPEIDEEDNSGAMLATGAFALAALAVAMLGKKRVNKTASKKEKSVVYYK